jgi:Aldehyde dehydrogenase family
MAMTYPNTQLMINNQWIDAEGSKTMPVVNPATGAEIGRLAHASIADLDKALAAAAAGFEIWRKTPVVERSKTMRKAAGLMRERVDAIAALMTQEQGKPLVEAKGEVLATVEVIEWFAEEGRRVYGRIIPARSMAVQNHAYKDPVGVVAAFTPWNFPINQITRKLCGALATGCSIIVKAPEETPASPAALIQAFMDAGVPDWLGVWQPCRDIWVFNSPPRRAQNHLHGLNPCRQATGRNGGLAHEALYDGTGRSCPRDCGRGRGHHNCCQRRSRCEIPQCRSSVHCPHALLGTQQY